MNKKMNELYLTSNGPDKGKYERNISLPSHRKNIESKAERVLSD